MLELLSSGPSFSPTTAEVLLSAALRMGLVTGDLASLGAGLPTAACTAHNIRTLLPGAGDQLTGALEQVRGSEGISWPSSLNLGLPS